MENINITSAKYFAEDGKNVSINAIIDGWYMSVPLDLANRHFAAIMKAVEDGELVIQEADQT